MKIKFTRNENGIVIAVDENGKKIGEILTMGDLVKKEGSENK